MFSPKVERLAIHAGKLGHYRDLGSLSNCIEEGISVQFFYMILQVQDT